MRSGSSASSYTSDGGSAVEMVAALKPDLVTMDIHMPKMDGLEATERIMAFTPTPILVVSSSVYGEGMGQAFNALSAGALEVIKKPEPADWQQLEPIGREIIRKVKVLANVKVITHVRGRRTGTPPAAVASVATAPAPPAPPYAHTLLAVGSSTGGPSALAKVIGALPADLSIPVVVAQHIADGFVPGLVSWLDGLCRVKVLVAEDGATMEPGCVYVAPTGLNLEVDTHRVHFSTPTAKQLYVPSADTLFASAAYSHGRRAIGVILTGMGSDGASGLKRLHDRGALTIAQDEKTSVVFGMPKAAIEAGAVAEVLPVDLIGAAVTDALKRKAAG
jgi:two-component system chemotaxis response regulator CheB